MTQSYLGIVTRKGLESLIPETEHAQELLRSLAAVRGSGPYYCCWAVLQRAIARDLQRRVRAEEFREALLVLNAEAQSLGSILPESDPCEEFTEA